MMIATIYKATCTVNGKSYVGFCTAWPRRKNHHKSLADRGSPYAFHRAIRKHGWFSFDWEILYQSHDIDHCLKVMEPHFIVQHESLGAKGYNMAPGGEGRRGSKSLEHRAKLSASSKRSAAKTRATKIAKYGPKGMRIDSQKLRDAWIRRKSKWGPLGHPGEKRPYDVLAAVAKGWETRRLNMEKKDIGDENCN